MLKINSDITLIMPIYNSGTFLSKTLDTIVQQTVPFAEIILVNDCSTDNTDEICKRYAKQYNNIRYISLDVNRGPGYARKIAISKVFTKYLCFADSDDILNLKYVETVLKYLYDGLDMLYFNIGIQKDYNAPWEETHEHIKALDFVTITGVEFLSFYPIGHTATTYSFILAKRLLDKYCHTYTTHRYNEDLIFILKCQFYAKKILFIPDNLYTRIIRENSLCTVDFTEEKCDAMLNPLCELWQWFKVKQSFLTDTFIRDCPRYTLMWILQNMQLSNDKDLIEQQALKLYSIYLSYWDDYCDDIYYFILKIFHDKGINLQSIIKAHEIKEHSK